MKALVVLQILGGDRLADEQGVAGRRGAVDVDRRVAHHVRLPADAGADQQLVARREQLQHLGALHTQAGRPMPRPWSAEHRDLRCGGLRCRIRPMPPFAAARSGRACACWLSYGLASAPCGCSDVLARQALPVDRRFNPSARASGFTLQQLNRETSTGAAGGYHYTTNGEAPASDRSPFLGGLPGLRHTLGIVLTAALGGALMALMFHSNRSERDATPGEAGTSRTATVTTSAPARKIGARANVGEPNVRGHNGDRCGR